MTPKPWIKLWSERLRASPRVRRLKPFAFGVYMRLLTSANEQGALKSGDHVWTVDDIALECNMPRGRERLRKSLDELMELGLIRRRSELDGALVVANLKELQTPPRKGEGATPPPRRSGGRRRAKGPQRIGGDDLAGLG